MSKILLIDGHSILNRAYYGVPLLTNHEGIHTNAVYGFINIMLKSIEEEEADSVAVAFDLKVPTFRHVKYPEYKGNRKPMPEELREQVPLMKDMLKAMNIPVITLEGFEADDILGTIAKKAQAVGMEAVILSGDRDLLQLADEHIKIRMPKTSKGKTVIEHYYPDEVINTYGVTPHEYIDAKALMGDTSDNVPGIDGVGEKTACSLISKYHDIDGVYANRENIRNAKIRTDIAGKYEQLKFSKWLVTIDINAPVEFPLRMRKSPKFSLLRPISSV